MKRNNERAVAAAKNNKALPDRLHNMSGVGECFPSPISNSYRWKKLWPWPRNTHTPHNISPPKALNSLQLSQFPPEELLPRWCCSQPNQQQLFWKRAAAMAKNNPTPQLPVFTRTIGESNPQ
ncbi:hypothetical protein Pelo_10323 [Pelomyxa schiedti]|nr:hypothetical protein Pelo_10323 [Pelomyxa schiedti]